MQHGVEITANKLDVAGSTPVASSKSLTIIYLSICTGQILVLKRKSSQNVPIAKLVVQQQRHNPAVFIRPMWSVSL
jgi:hypothetical protein